jgi:hypothetical protein
MLANGQVLSSEPRAEPTYASDALSDESARAAALRANEPVAPARPALAAGR